MFNLGHKGCSTKEKKGKNYDDNSNDSRSSNSYGCSSCKGKQQYELKKERVTIMKSMYENIINAVKAFVENYMNAMEMYGEALFRSRGCGVYA